MLRYVWVLLAIGLGAVAGRAHAIASEDQIARLGKDLTPTGAEQAGNAEGSIPEWTGVYPKPTPSWKQGEDRPDPFGDDKPSFSIDASNVDQYTDKLSPGQIDLIKRYKGYRMDIYPTRRACAFPKWVNERSRQNARVASLAADGEHIKSGWGPVMFPLPANGAEAIWNHILPYAGTVRAEAYQANIIPTKSGEMTPVHERALAMSFFGDRKLTSFDDSGGLAAYYLLEKLAPARLAGEIVLVHEFVNEKRRAWLYNPGQRRVRRAPTVAYDNPIVATESLMVNDQARIFNGELDRYEWKLLGKKEMYIPYNNLRIYGSDKSLSYEELLGPLYPRRDWMRYELHRVWVVEATVKPGMRHLFARRVIYIDEDSWVASASDVYDQRGEIWRIMEGGPVLLWEYPACVQVGIFSYDIIAGRYVAYGMTTHEPNSNQNADLTEAMFTPNALRNMGQR